MQKNVILYAKGHIEKSNNLLFDLKKVLILDGYSSHINNNDVYHIITNQFFNNFKHNTYDMLNDISEKNCFKFGYITKHHPFPSANKSKVEKYNLEKAILYWVISQYRLMELNELPEKLFN